VVYAAETANEIRWCDVETPWLSDAWSCPKCTRPLRFSPTDWSCECGFARPLATTSLAGDELTVDGRRANMHLSLPGNFNRANAAMALTALVEVGAEFGPALERVAQLVDVAGRFGVRHWRGHELRLTLAKNPAGFTAMLETIDAFAGELWIAINARVADGRDPSWLYDVPFERLRGRVVHCFGERRLDLATRLDYAEVAYELSGADSPPLPNSPVTVLANYTAFQEWLERSAK